MNSENIQASESHTFKLDIKEKRYLKDPKKNMALANLSIYYTWKTSNQNTTAINLKFQL